METPAFRPYDATTEYNRSRIAQLPSQRPFHPTSEERELRGSRCEGQAQIPEKPEKRKTDTRRRTPQRVLRPSDEISPGDCYVGLPHRHLPLSEFLTLSAVLPHQDLVAFFHATSAYRISSAHRVFLSPSRTPQKGTQYSHDDKLAKNLPKENRHPGPEHPFHPPDQEEEPTPSENAAPLNRLAIIPPIPASRNKEERGQNNHEELKHSLKRKDLPHLGKLPEAT